MVQKTIKSVDCIGCDSKKKNDACSVDPDFSLNDCKQHKEFSISNNN